MEEQHRAWDSLEHGTIEISTDFGPMVKTVTPNIVPSRWIEGRDGTSPQWLAIVPERLIPAPLSPDRRLVVLTIMTAVTLHAAFAALLLLLLVDWHDLPIEAEHAIPVEIVESMPEVQKPQAEASPAPAPPPPSPEPPPPSSPQPPASSGDGAPPPEPMRAMSQPRATDPVDPTPQPLEPKREAASTPPAEAPAVLSSQGGSFAVAPATPPAPDHPAVPMHPAKTAPKVSLADALPMDLSALPSTFRAVLSGSGAQVSQEYKGLVYGQLQRSHRGSEEAAAHHLHGQVSVSFTVDQAGHASDLKVVNSSGNVQLDAIGLGMVREAEPFPPPPPSDRQVFTPRFDFGVED